MTRTVWAAVVAVLVGGGVIQVGAVARRHAHGGWWSAQRATNQGAQGTTTGQTTSSQGQTGRPGGPPPGVLGGERGGGPPAPSIYNNFSGEWWKDPEVRKEIALRPDQATKIDDIYSRRVKDTQPVIDEYQKEQETLDKMLAERVVSEATLSLQLTKFNTLRLAISQSRYLMLYRISRVLDTDQNAKLKALFERRQKEEMDKRRGRGGAPAPAAAGNPR